VLQGPKDHRHVAAALSVGQGASFEMLVYFHDKPTARSAKRVKNSRLGCRAEEKNGTVLGNSAAKNRTALGVRAL